MTPETKNEFLDRYLTPIAVLAGAALIAAALFFGNGFSGKGGPQGTEPDSAVNALAIADSVGLDTDRIQDLVEKNAVAYQESVSADMAEGQAFGIQGTPGSVVGTQLVPGAFPLEDVLATINGTVLSEDLVRLSTEAAAVATTPVDITKAKLENHPSIGRPDAPKIMAVWFDFQCSYCKRFEATTLSELERTLVASGELRIVYKDFQFLSPESNQAALYSRAIWEAYPDRWHEWYKAMLSQ